MIEQDGEPVLRAPGGEPDYYQEILEVMCWCEERIVRVPREELHRGMTYPCKRKECVLIAESKGWRKPVRKGQERAKVARSLVTKMAVREMRSGVSRSDQG